MDTPSSLPRLLAVKAVAESLSLSTGRVYELIRLQMLPAVYLGERQVRVSEEALRSFITAGGNTRRPANIDSLAQRRNLQ
jgi:excisionase family DNA binding protein